MQETFFTFRLKWGWRIAVFFIALVTLIMAGKVAKAASLYISPAAKSVAVGQEFSAVVYVSSSDQAMNAVSGVLSFPTDKLQVTSLSKAGSIVSLWVQDPSFSNAVGTVNFEGIVMNPGFTGTGGRLLTINFKAKAPGAADVVFASGEVLANDGKGTNVLRDLGGAKFSVEVAVSNPPPVQANLSQTTIPKETAGVEVPKINSPTHPDPEGWYANPNPKFIWELPRGLTSVRTLFDDKPVSKPTVVYSPPITEKELKDVPDGIWYFHLQFRKVNSWGAIAHFRFQIDTKPPEPFKIELVDGKEVNTPRPTILFNTVDSLSGIDHYQIKVGEGDFNTLASDAIKSNPYTLPPQSPGRRTILVKAVDRAGNYATAVEEVMIKALPSPVVTYYPHELSEDQTLIIRGTTLPKAGLILWIVEEKGQPVTHNLQSDENGNFTFVNPNKLKDGVYSFWLVAGNEQGAKSEPTEKYSFIVQQPTFWRISTKITGLLGVIVPLAALIIVLVFLLWYSWHKFKLFKKKLRRETGRVEETLHQIFQLIKNDLAEFLKIFEKNKHKSNLTEEENEIVKRLKKNLQQMEEFVEEEVKDIEKTVK